MSKRAIARLRSDPVMSQLIERVGTIRLRPRRLEDRRMRIVAQT